MSVRVLNRSDLEWKDSEAPALYRTGYAELAIPLGARKLGYHVELLPPRTALCPYHAHLVNEELFVVLEGKPAMRLESGEHHLAPGDLVALPPGARSAHQLLNRMDRPARVLVASTMIEREVVDYPDSGKRLIAIRGLVVDGFGSGPSSGSASGSSGEPPPESRARALLRDGRLVDYFDGEPAFEPFATEPPVPEVRDPRILRMDDVPWKPFAYGPFAGEGKRLGQAAGAVLLGYTLYRLTPGQQPWAYHFHHVNEEYFHVRSGHGEVRTADGTRALRPGDSFACLAGPEGAHAIRNTGSEPLEYFALSTMEVPEIVEYPDSGKLGVQMRSAPGRSPVAMFRLKDAVGYADGEG